MIKSNLTEVQSQNGACLIKIISCLRYLARQGLPTSTWTWKYQESNFKQLLNCRAEDDPVFSEWLIRKNQNFTIPETQNEFSARILKRCFHSIMVDETSDASNKEQAVFCVRWVDENLFSYEDF